MKRVVVLILLALLFALTAQAQSRGDLSALKDLLAMPAPTPRTKDESEDNNIPIRPEEFYDRKNAPPDDAAIEDLVGYWARWTNSPFGPKPSAVVSQRLVDFSLSNPAELQLFLQFFPTDEAAIAKVKELYDKPPAEEQENYWREPVKRWLLHNSNHFLGELLRLANKVKDNQWGGVDNIEALRALAKLDWQAAEPLLASLMSNSQPRTQALVLSLFYQHAIADKNAGAEDRFRNQLKAIAGDRGAPGWARDDAIESLLLTEWSGRDEWYLSLLRDQSLIQLHDGHQAFSTLVLPLARDPDKWIPIMAKLVKSADTAVQQAAGSCLVRYANSNPRRDGILPVLRWLSEPDWIPLQGTERAWFMQKMSALEIPESVPGLIWIVENEASNQIWAARTLAHYKDPRALPALRKALAAETSEDNRKYILEGLLASGGFSESEQVEALEAFATKVSTLENKQQFLFYGPANEEPLPIPVSVGRYLATLPTAPDSLVRLLLARVEGIRKTNPVVAQVLLETAHRWTSRQVDLDLINRIANGTADASTISTALERRTTLRKTVGHELQSLINGAGPAPGIAAALLDNASLAQSVLGSGNELAKIGLLASARLTRLPLAVDVVGVLLKSKVPLMQEAARKFLLAEDSPAARQLLWSHYPNQAFITGWRENIDTLGGSDFEALGRKEEKLQAELLDDKGPTEIFALLNNTTEAFDYVIRIYPDKTVYTFYEDKSRYRERAVSKAELSTIKNFLTANKVDDLGPQFGNCHHNCWSTELLFLTKEKGRRVFNQEGFDGLASKVVAQFELLNRNRAGKTHYAFEKEIKGLEVLYEDANPLIKDFWKRGNDTRVFVERSEDTEDRKGDDESDEEREDPERDREKRRRQALHLLARLSWRNFTAGRVGEPKAKPDGYSTFDITRFSPDDDNFSLWFDQSQVGLISTDSIVIARNFDGLWRQNAGQKAVRISGDGGAYQNPVVTSDGEWVVVAKSDTDWSKPNYLIRFGLQTGSEHRVDLAPADRLDPIAYVAPHRKVLIRRAREVGYSPSEKSTGPARPEYFLLDPSTGHVQKVSGEFAPLFQAGNRSLQPSGKANEFWAAMPDAVKNKTQIGRYNLKNFTFRSVLDIPQIEFDSMAIWIDEDAGKVYLVYRGQLLRFPLQAGQ